MQRPRVSSDVLILPASFSRSPVFCVRAYLSEPARSQNDNLHNQDYQCAGDGSSKANQKGCPKKAVIVWIELFSPN